MSFPDEPARWLERFHAGERVVLEACYREHFATATRAIGRLVSGADRETIVHEVFLRLLRDPALRQAFDGRALGGWIATVTRNHAIDFLRRHGREARLPDLDAARPGAQVDGGWQDRTHAQMLVARFVREILPPKWHAVFAARFLRQLSQREAAAELHIHRTTLAYQELCIRRLLRRFLLKPEGS